MRNADLQRQELAYTEGLRSSVVVEEGPFEALIPAAAARVQAELIVTGIGRTGPPGPSADRQHRHRAHTDVPRPLLVVKKIGATTPLRLSIGIFIQPKACMTPLSSPSQY